MREPRVAAEVREDDRKPRRPVALSVTAIPPKPGVKQMTKHKERSSRFQFPVQIPSLRLARSRAGLAVGAAGGLMLLSVTAAWAISVVLAPGASLVVPATTDATEPDLGGVVLQDTLVPFTIKAPDGAVVCAGKLQDRVVRSTKTGLLHFYYAIRETEGPGAVGRIATASFSGLKLRVAYRTDGLGTVPPRVAARNAAPGPLVTFELTDPPVSCARHEESRFMLIKTTVKAFHTGGATRIFATTGAEVAVPTLRP
jgi:hypothetical protein